MLPWIYKETVITDIPENMIGFIYVITNLIDGRKYFGKKKAFFSKTSTKTVTLKSGVKKKRRSNPKFHLIGLPTTVLLMS